MSLIETRPKINPTPTIQPDFSGLSDSHLAALRGMVEEADLHGARMDVYQAVCREYRRRFGGRS